MIVLPPANQVASSGSGNANATPGEGGAGGDHEQALGALGHQQGAGGLVTEDGGLGGSRSGGLTAGTHGGGSGNASGNAPGVGTASAGNGGKGSGSSGNAAGTSTGAGGSGSGEALGTGLAGFTRITFPKEGKFGVVVLGYAGSVPYPESVGALSGKVVYTVYLRVGLRRSWILQYCLPKAAEGSVARNRSATRLDAPWPYLVMRPDQWSASDPDYVMVHGTLTSAGKFDQMTMAFPDELEKKELLLKSLKLWAFRPASRDGEPIAVEVLLIIPREPAQ
jgi:hypothetical protein